MRKRIRHELHGSGALAGAAVVSGLYRVWDGLDLRDVPLGDSRLISFRTRKEATVARRQFYGGDPTRGFNRFWRFWVLMSPLSMPHSATGRVELVAEDHALLWVRLEPETRGYRWLRIEQAERIGEHVISYRLVCQCGWTREEREWAGDGVTSGVLCAYERHIAWHRAPWQVWWLRGITSSQPWTEPVEAGSEADCRSGADRRNGMLERLGVRKPGDPPHFVALAAGQVPEGYPVPAPETA